MEKSNKKKWIGFVLINLLIAFTLTMLLDLTLVIMYRALSMVRFAAVFAAGFLLSSVISAVVGRTWKIVMGSLSVAVWMILAAAFLCWNDVSREVSYVAADSGKSELYGGHRVMLLVPHQDDDINVLGGVIEEYVKYGSEVYVVFSTNGDYYGLGEVRLKEAVNAMAVMGVPEDHIIFLGYGDQWNPEGPHIYNAESGVVVQSVFGSTQTYGTDWHGAYQEGNAYTIDNFLGDIESVILEYRPDILYCVDYDYNIDHKALMLSFEKVMGRILSAQQDYRPLVFKGYAYNTAWESEADFYGDNLLSTQNIFVEPYLQQPAVYRWEERIRLPVHAEALSRSAVRSGAYEALSQYASQGAGLYTVRVYNSDKVFWHRSSNSLCYGAQIQTSSGSADCLNNFMLLDNLDLTDDEHMPYDGTWIPETGDKEKCATVTFAQPQELSTIVLYDHPDPEKNVRNAVITFDDGTSVETGPLDPGGAATCIALEKIGVTSFTVAPVHVEGQGGLTEIEAYCDRAEPELTFVKIMDEEENFVYDYWIHSGGKQEFSLYVSGRAPAASAEQYLLSSNNDRCTVSWSGEQILVECPEGESCTITVASMDGSISDTVFIRNPGSAERAWKMFWLRAEELVMRLCEKQRLHERLVICRLYTKIPEKLEALFS